METNDDSWKSNEYERAMIFNEGDFVDIFRSLFSSRNILVVCLLTHLLISCGCKCFDVLVWCFLSCPHFGWGRDRRKRIQPPLVLVVCVFFQDSL
jgi:hypothetical protein